MKGLHLLYRSSLSYPVWWKPALSLLARRHLNPVWVIYQSEVRNSRFNICSEITTALPCVYIQLNAHNKFLISTIGNPACWFQRIFLSFVWTDTVKVCSHEREALRLCSALLPWPVSNLEGKSGLCMFLVWEQRHKDGERGSHHSPGGDSHTHRQFSPSNCWQHSGPVMRVATQDWTNLQEQAASSSQHCLCLFPWPSLQST